MKIEVLTIITAKKYRVQKQHLVQYDIISWHGCHWLLTCWSILFRWVLSNIVSCGYIRLISPVPNSAGVWIAESIHRYIMLKARIVLYVCLRNRFKTFHKQNYNTSTHLGLAEGHVLFVPFECKIKLNEIGALPICDCIYKAEEQVVADIKPHPIHPVDKVWIVPLNHNKYMSISVFDIIHLFRPA